MKKTYLKHYNPRWEKDPVLKGKAGINITYFLIHLTKTEITFRLYLPLDWIQPTEERDVIRGKPEAFCKVCQCHIRAHRSDLVTHSTRQKHLDKVKLLDCGKKKD